VLEDVTTRHPAYGALSNTHSCSRAPTSPLLRSNTMIICTAINAKKETFFLLACCVNPSIPSAMRRLRQRTAGSLTSMCR